MKNKKEPYGKTERKERQIPTTPYNPHVKPAIKEILFFKIRMSPIKMEISFGSGKSYFLEHLMTLMIISDVTNSMSFGQQNVF